jgi:hypothetical protein
LGNPSYIIRTESEVFVQKKLIAEKDNTTEKSDEK